MRNQLTHNELEEFFRSLQDLLVLLLNPSLSFDSAEFLSQRLDGFERTLTVLSSRLRVSYWSEVQLLSDFDTLLFIVSQQRQHCEDLSYFSLHAEEEEQLSTARVGVVRSGVPWPGRPRLDISEDLLEVLRNHGARFRWVADSSSSSNTKRVVLKTKRSEFFRNRRGVMNSRETPLGPAAKKDEEAKKKEFTRVERQAWVK